MPEIVNEIAAAYALNWSEPTDALLYEIEKYTLEQHAQPNMLSGPLQGKFLEIISRIVRPQRILEIGTFTGYSALCLAKGLTEDGELHTIEMRHEDVELSRGYFDRSPQGDQITIHEGNALDIIPKLDHTWDLVFIDADKTNYINYYELTLPVLKSGGLILADNVLFHGEVLADAPKGKNAVAIQAFNEHIARDARVQQVILTIRDGISMIIKK